MAGGPDSGTAGRPDLTFPPNARGPGARSCRHARRAAPRAPAAWALLTATALLALAPARGSSAAGDVLSDFLYYEEELRIKNPAKPVRRVLTGIGDRYLGVVDSEDRVRVWDLDTGREEIVEGRWPARVRSVFPNARGGNLVVVDGAGRVYETVGLSFAEKVTLLDAGAAVDAVAVSDSGTIIAGARGSTLHTFNLSTRESEAIALGTGGEKAENLAVSSDGRFVAYQTRNKLAVLDLDLRTTFPVPLVSGAVGPEFFVGADGGLGLSQLHPGGRLVMFAFDGKKFQEAGQLDLGASASALRIERRGEVFWSRGGAVYRSRGLGERAETFYEGKEPVSHVRVIKSTGNVMIYEQAGRFRIYDSGTGRAVAAGISTGNGWAVVDANKRYDASEGGTKDVVWAVQNLDLDLGKFAKQFYEPGLLLHYVSRLQLEFLTSGTTEKLPLPPRIDEVRLLENVAGSGRTVVFATAHNISADVSDVEMYHNGRKLGPNARVVDEGRKQDDVDVRSIAYEISPLPGLNVVSVVGVGALGVEGPTRELSFERPGHPRRRLHVLAIGIDEYAAPELKLGYARNDASSIVSLLDRSEGFDGVTSTALYDQEGTRERILEAFASVTSASEPGDIIVIYLAGHGIALSGDWYFMSSSVASQSDTEVLRASVSAKEIAEALRGAKARHVVLMVDACNSGAVVRDIKGLQQYRVYNRLGRDADIVVLAASRRDQNAFERVTLGHGVFTSAMIAGLSGKADRNRDGRVTARELVSFASREIPTLAIEHLNEVQIPVAYAPNDDFVVRMVR